MDLNNFGNYTSVGVGQLPKFYKVGSGIHSLYRSPNIVRMIKSRRLRWVGHVARMEEGRSSFKILTDIPAGKRPLGKPRRRSEEIIMDLKEI